MSADAIRAKYDELHDVANALEALAERAEQVEKNISQARQDLSGEWVGFGADRFFDEIDNDIIPALGKLGAALHSASTTTTLISEKLLDTETTGAALIRGLNGAAQGTNPNSPWGDAGTPMGTSAPGNGAAGAADGSVINSDGTVDIKAIDNNALEIYKKEGDIYPYMDEFAQLDENGNRYEVPVKDEAALNQRMEELMQAVAQDPNHQPPDAMLREMAELRGVEFEDFKQDYQEFKSLLAHANTNYDYLALDTDRHPDFLSLIHI